jgi:hypothetical protein
MEEVLLEGTMSPMFDIVIRGFIAQTPIRAVLLGMKSENVKLICCFTS